MRTDIHNIYFEMGKTAMLNMFAITFCSNMYAMYCNNHRNSIGANCRIVITHHLPVSTLPNGKIIQYNARLPGRTQEGFSEDPIQAIGTPGYANFSV